MKVKTHRLTPGLVTCRTVHDTARFNSILFHNNHNLNLTLTDLH